MSLCFMLMSFSAFSGNENIFGRKYTWLKVIFLATSYKLILKWNNIMYSSIFITIILQQNVRFTNYDTQKPGWLSMFCLNIIILLKSVYPYEIVAKVKNLSFFAQTLSRETVDKYKSVLSQISFFKLLLSTFFPYFWAVSYAFKDRKTVKKVKICKVIYLKNILVQN